MVTPQKLMVTPVLPDFWLLQLARGRFATFCFATCPRAFCGLLVLQFARGRFATSCFAIRPQAFCRFLVVAIRPRAVCRLLRKTRRAPHRATPHMSMLLPLCGGHTPRLLTTTTRATTTLATTTSTLRLLPPRFIQLVFLLLLAFYA